MSWNEKRIVSILSAILAILLAALLIVLSIRYREKRQHQLENPDSPTVQGQVLESTAYTGLYVDNGNTTLTFSLGENGSWIWADDPSFPLNDEIVLTLVDLLDHVKPQQTLPMEGGPEAFALESPRATVEGTRADGSLRTIQLGKATSDGASYYAMIDGDETTVYILPGTLHDLLNTPIYDMCRLPVLPELTEEMISSIVVQGPLGQDGQTPTVTLTAAHEKKETSWTSDSLDVTENARVQALLDDIKVLQLQRCVDFAPSENAVQICGLTSPAAVLNVNYLSENGSEQTLQVQVGARLRDGSGRYIRINSDETIYLLPTELLDPLMAIAARGLDA